MTRSSRWLLLVAALAAAVPLASAQGQSAPPSAQPVAPGSAVGDSIAVDPLITIVPICATLALLDNVRATVLLQRAMAIDTEPAMASADAEQARGLFAKAALLAPTAAAKHIRGREQLAAVLASSHLQVNRLRHARCAGGAAGAM